MAFCLVTCAALGSFEAGGYFGKLLFVCLRSVKASSSGWCLVGGAEQCVGIWLRLVEGWLGAGPYNGALAFLGQCVRTAKVSVLLLSGIA
ncbi:hypothetical protein Tco_0848850 [Tanacetum coccineum]